MSGDNCANFSKDLIDSLRCFSSFNLFNINDRFRFFPIWYTTPLINAALLNLKLYLRRDLTAHGWPTPYWGLLKENIIWICSLGTMLVIMMSTKGIVIIYAGP